MRIKKINARGADIHVTGTEGMTVMWALSLANRHGVMPHLRENMTRLEREWEQLVDKLRKGGAFKDVVEVNISNRTEHGKR